MTFPLAKFCVVGHVEYYYLQLYIHENCSVISYAVISDLAEAANLREKKQTPVNKIREPVSLNISSTVIRKKYSKRFYNNKLR